MDTPNENSSGSGPGAEGDRVRLMCGMSIQFAVGL